MELYNILEEDVIPMFYRRSHDDVPRDWVEKMRAGLRYLVPVFNSHRMVQEYMDRYYLPCSRRFNVLSSNDFTGTKELASWRQRLLTGWSDISVIEINTDQCRELPVGGYLTVTAKIKLGSLTPDDVTVEAYFGRLDHVGEFAARDTASMLVQGMDNGVYIFKGNIPNANTGRFGFTVRVLPSKNRLENPFVMGLVTWA
jgi:glycogen phosphorylase